MCSINANIIYQRTRCYKLTAGDTILDRKNPYTGGDEHGSRNPKWEIRLVAAASSKASCRFPDRYSKNSKKRGVKSTSKLEIARANT